jgi:hypothetical protein
MGYDKDENGELIINEKEAAHMRRIVDKYLMLQNEKLAGDALLQKTITVDFLTHKRVKNEGQVP